MAVVNKRNNAFLALGLQVRICSCISSLWVSMISATIYCPIVTVSAANAALFTRSDSYSLIWPIQVLRFTTSALPQVIMMPVTLLLTWPLPSLTNRSTIAASDDVTTPPSLLSVVVRRSTSHGILSSISNTSILCGDLVILAYDRLLERACCNSE